MVSQKLPYATQSFRQFRYLDMGVLTPIHTKNPCVNGVRLLVLYCLVLPPTLCGSFLQLGLREASWGVDGGYHPHPLLR